MPEPSAVASVGSAEAAAEAATVVGGDQGLLALRWWWWGDVLCLDPGQAARVRR